MIHNIDPQLSQWDVGRVVSISDSNATHLHFANQGDSKAVIIEITSGSAKIPDFLLQTGKPVIAYAVLDGVTLESKSFPVRKRERPENYVYEDDQRNYIYELIASAEDAIEIANQATASANTAAGSANLASTRANEAAASATDASDKATLATQNANEAAERANEAVTKANNAVKNMMVVVEAKGSVIALNDSSEQSLVGLRVFGKSTQNGTPTPENPVELESVGASGSIGVTVAGNNLFDKENAETVGGYLDPNGKLVGNASIGTTWFVPVSENTKYTISTNSPGGFYFRAISFLDAAKSLIGFDGKDTNTYGTVFTGVQSANYFTTATFTTPKGCKYVQVGSLNQNFGSDSTIMLNYGDTVLPYEPYKEIQTLTASTPNGLPGIPVSSGGNYTDENGQAWICDEIDFARGVYVQRVKQFVVDENTSFNKHAYTTDEYFVCYTANTGAAATKACISNLFINNTNSNMLKTSACIYIQSDTKDPLHFSVPISIATSTTSFKNWAIENDLCVLYPLATPIETALSPEELEAYAKLHTNKPDTIVFNDSGAYVSVKYIADTKSYIDNITPDENGNVVPEIVPTAETAFSAGVIIPDNGKFISYAAAGITGGADYEDGKIILHIDAAEEGSTNHVAGSIDVTDIIKNVKSIEISVSGKVTDLYLSKNDHAWGIHAIKKLAPGFNDISTIDFTGIDKIYFLTAIYGNEPPSTGEVLFTIRPKGIVYADKFVGQERYPTFADIDIPGKFITCWGDSLTAQGGWTDVLSGLSGMPVYNGGTGGENAKTIMARQGGDVMMVNNVTIPASGEVILARYDDGGFDTFLGHKVTPMLQHINHINPVMLGNIKGTLKWSGAYPGAPAAGTHWSFTREVDGEEIIINRPTAIRTQYDISKNNPHLMVIFIGTNGGYDDLDDLVNKHRLMIAHAKANNVVILGFSNGSADYRADYEARMTKEFGRYFISLRDYLSKYGLEDAGLTPTEADTSAMENGSVPPQLLKDTVHYTDVCKSIIGNMLYKKCCELGIFNY